MLYEIVTVLFSQIVIIVIPFIIVVVNVVNVIDTIISVVVVIAFIHYPTTIIITIITATRAFLFPIILPRRQQYHSLLITLLLII